MQENYKGLKVAVCMCGWGKLGTRYKKTKNPTDTAGKLAAKARATHAPLHIAPPRGWADHLLKPFGLTPGCAPSSPHIRNHPLIPHIGSEQESTFFFAPSSAAGVPVKPCLNFLSGFMSISTKEANYPGR